MTPGRLTRVRAVRSCAGLGAACLSAAFLGAMLSAQEPTTPQESPGAQAPPVSPRPRTPRPNMQAMNEALGVRCPYCHVPSPRDKDELDYKSEANPRKRVARLMVAMTADINASMPAAVLKASGEATQVTCATCHRGVPDPRPLPDIIARAVEEQGIDQALTHFRDLRAQYFGRDAYDFSEQTLQNVARRFLERSPEVALALMRTNLEFYPSSAENYVLMAVAETRRLDDAAAIQFLEKALTLNPRHSMAQGYLAQLKQYRKRQ